MLPAAKEVKSIMKKRRRSIVRIGDEALQDECFVLLLTYRQMLAIPVMLLADLLKMTLMMSKSLDRL